ncbi:helix-turn-helix domain-containing protein [Parasporobacterium paucivorans]|uniref:helix-turn-helix domain-containing protein n=1 Tax=Parasporobacterium paucivorans TaxID=115544 RepID=UPI00093C8DAC|nr:helix-turn-helix domain-containing protein [Parasporobacterium paucivorans]
MITNFKEYESVVTPEELNGRLRIGMNQVYRILSSGEIKACREGRVWHVSKQAVIGYIMRKIKLGYL